MTASLWTFHVILVWFVRSVKIPVRTTNDRVLWPHILQIMFRNSQISDRQHHCLSHVSLQRLPVCSQQAGWAKVKNLLVLCTNQQMGCKWKGDLSELESHVHFLKHVSSMQTTAPNTVGNECRGEIYSITWKRLADVATILVNLHIWCH